MRDRAAFALAPSNRVCGPLLQQQRPYFRWFFSFFLPFFSLKVPDSEVPPWISSSSSGGGTGGRNNADISSVWNTDEKFRQSILEELLKDCLHMEVAGIVSATLVVSRVVVAYLLMIQFRYSLVPNNRVDKIFLVKNAYTDLVHLTDKIKLNTEFKNSKRHPCLPVY